MSLSLRAGGPAGKKGCVVGMWEVLCGPKGISGEGSTLMSGWGAISSRGCPAPRLVSRPACVASASAMGPSADRAAATAPRRPLLQHRRSTFCFLFLNCLNKVTILIRLEVSFNRPGRHQVLRRGRFSIYHHRAAWKCRIITREHEPGPASVSGGPRPSSRFPV